MTIPFNDEDEAAFDRAIVRVEGWLEEFEDTDNPNVELAEEELRVLMRLRAFLKGE